MEDKSPLDNPNSLDLSEFPEDLYWKYTWPSNSYIKKDLLFFFKKDYSLSIYPLQVLVTNRILQTLSPVTK